MRTITRANSVMLLIAGPGPRLDDASRSTREILVNSCNDMDRPSSGG